MVDGKLDQNISILLNLKWYLVTLKYAQASSNLICNIYKVFCNEME